MVNMVRGLAAAVALACAWNGAVASAAPLEAYGRLPAMESVDLSPDGGMIAVIVQAGEQRQVIVRRLDGTTVAQVALGDRKVREVQWAGNDHIIITVSQVSSADGNFYTSELVQALSLNVRTGKYVQLPSKSLNNLFNVIMGQIDVATVRGETFAFAPILSDGGYQRKGSHLDLYRLDLDTGEAVVHQMGDADVRQFLIGADGVVLAKASAKDRENQGDTLVSIDVKLPSGWKTVVSTSVSDESPDLYGLSADGRSVIIDSWDDKEKVWRLVPVSLSDGAIGDYIGPARQQGAITDRDQKVLGVTHRTAFIEYDFSEPHLKAAWPMVRAAFKDRQVRLRSWSADFSKLILYVDAGVEAGGYYLLDVPTKRAMSIGSAYPGVPAAEVGEVKAVRYKAADGMDIEGYLTLPRGRAAANLPLVVLPHGGPRARDEAGFDWMAQGLASRGYAVLQPNFRGSTGYTRAFKDAGYGEWGAKMQTDLSDGVAYLATQGVVDPKRVCIMGASYGGYAALAGVTLQKDVYRCSVAIAGVADLGRMMRDDILKYGGRSAMVRDEQRLFGVDSVNDPKIAERSPLQQAAKASAPILLIHGKDDTVVPYAQSTAMAQALKAAGKPHDFVTLPGEDHWMSRGATRLQMLNAAIAFVEKHNPPGVATAAN